jgi:BirA family biotin operon repressor/biotin-[acetyl-CoA-carboxylase] ligase
MPRPHLHFAEISSTMDMAKQEAGNTDFLLVTAESQTQGRGTKGRPWQSPKGNIYLTVAIHNRFATPERLALLPLEAGLTLWESTAAFLPPSHRSRLRLKWPNDLLWEGRKTAGMLMEFAGDHLLIGAGINVAEAPPIADGGTSSACLSEAGLSPASALPLATAFFDALRNRVERPQPRDTVAAWREKSVWDVPHRLRDRPGRPEVMPVDLNAEGQLRVRFSDGTEQWLVSEYLA